MSLKLQIKRMAAKLGLRVVRVRPNEESVTVSSSGFAGLTRAYEKLLTDQDPRVPIPRNDRRAALLGQLLGTSIPEAYSIIHGLAATANVPGDVCEFGVAQGSTSVLIANELMSEGRGLHLFDSFVGMPEPTADDELKDDSEGMGSIEAYAGRWAYPKDLVEARLARIGFPPQRTHIHAGFIEEVLAEARGLPEMVSFAYVDLDFYEPIRVTLGFLHRLLSPGAVVVVDDYDYFSTGAKKAVDEFIAARNRDLETYEFKVADEAFGHFASLRRIGL